MIKTAKVPMAKGMILYADDTWKQTENLLEISLKPSYLKTLFSSMSGLDKDIKRHFEEPKEPKTAPEPQIADYWSKCIKISGFFKWLFSILLMCQYIFSSLMNGTK
ncbi:hypothetical protein CHARACLAT_003957 [Characodon lateralis]|uniref:Uncharacterized protein n=1 Tax=Characodon lateralis TaxID=208331 RepID=A0ABU7CK82_9TELE|nr:hypothetical protein [Characodon lateralis]